MSRRRRDNDESSLELLLDTMCNTFGGVMFIAIMLFVFTANMVQQQSTALDTDPAELYRQAEALRLVLADLQRKISLRDEELKKLKIDSQDRRHREVMLLEKTVQEKTLAVQTITTRLDAARQIQTVLDNKLARLRQEQLSKEIKSTDLSSQLTAVKQEIEQNKAQLRSQKELTFKLIQPGNEDPFFLILAENMVYPVGPWRQQDQTDTPDAAVASRNISDDLVECRIRPGSGIPVLDNNEFSQEFETLLKKIPSDRVPKFYIYPNAASTAYRMREIFKKNSARHGCTLAINNDEPFIYQYTPNAQYEY